LDKNKNRQKFNVLLSIHEFEKIKNTEMKKRKTKVKWTECQNDIHIDFGHIKLNGKIKNISDYHKKF
jgi:hypothetical protein